MGIGSKENLGDRAMGAETRPGVVEAHAWSDPNRGARAAARPPDKMVRLDALGRLCICA